MSVKKAPSHLVLVFVATAGQNGENLGSDEAQIVLFVYLLYDVTKNKIIDLHTDYVRASLEDNVLGDNILTEECRIQTGLDDDAIRAAQPIEQVLDEFDRFISSKGVHPDNSGSPFVFMCDGQLHFRLTLHPEASRKSFTLPHYFSKFYDIRKEFKKMYKVEVVNCIKDMLDYLNLEGIDHMDYGVKHCQEMAAILHRLLADGHQLGEPEVIKDKLEPGICTKDEDIDEESVIRARGLPWQSSDTDIAKFFKGLNVAKGGVALCLSQQGRRNGEALIRFESKEHRDLALRKHKHHLGQRYIEVYRASGKDFLDIAGGSNTEAVKFLQRHGDDGEQIIVRMRGLPYSCTTEQVLEFFRGGEDPCEVLDGEDGVLFVHQADGRATGDAFVLFASEPDAAKALAMHRHVIGTRYIELFKSTTAEVQQVLNRSMDPRANAADHNHNTSVSEHHGQLSLLPHLPAPAMPGMPTPPGGVILPQQLITCGTTKDCLRMRGLPFEASVTDILTFLGEFAKHIVFQGVHMVYNAQGTPSGEAFIQMDSEQVADVAAMSKHKKFMFISGKKRFIEVFQCSGEDMNLVLTNGLLPSPVTGPLHNGAIPGAAAMPGALPGALPNGLPNGMHALPHAAMPNGLHNGIGVGLPAVSSAPMPGLMPAVSLGPLGAMGMVQSKPLFSPGGSMLAQSTSSLGPAGHPGLAGMFPYATMQPPSVAVSASQNAALLGAAAVQPLATSNPLMMAPSPGTMPAGLGSMPGLPAAGLGATLGAAQAAMRPPNAAAAMQSAAAGPYGLPQMLYWYPSPPVSPQNAAFYVQACPTTVVMKGVHFNAQIHDVLAFLEGIYEMTPDVQIQRTPDGRSTGEVYITFGSRAEAERAITERNRKVMLHRYIEMHMA